MSSPQDYKYRAYAEKWLPLTISLLVGICIFIKKCIPKDIQNFTDILSSVINFGAIIIGFLATMVSVLIALTGKRVIRRIQKNNATGLFTSYFVVPIVLGLLMIILSIFLMPLEKCDDFPTRVLFSLWIINIVYFLTSSFRIIRILQKVFKDIVNEYEESKKPEIVVPDQTTIFGNK